MKLPVLPALLILVFSTFTVQAQEDGPLVLTSVGPVHQAALALLDGSGVGVENLPASPRSLEAQPTLFGRQREQFADRFRAAEAVIGIGALWAQDPLYPAAREANIRIVPIDASRPWSLDFTGVAVARSPVTGEVSPWFWTAPSNIVRMLDIMARDLQALFPEQAQTIAANLEEERRFYQGLRADFETRLLDAEDPALYALAEEFVYLSRDLGLFVEGYFVKQDIDWTEEDHAALTETLRDTGVKIVIHKWEPSTEIQSAIEAAGARLVVLDTLETTTADMREGVAGNLRTLLDALIP